MSIISDIGFLLNSGVLAVILLAVAYYGWRWAKPKIMVSTFQAALTLGVIELTARKAGITDIRYGELVSKIEKMDYKEKTGKQYSIDEKVQQMVNAKIDESFKKATREPRKPKKNSGRPRKVRK